MCRKWNDPCYCVNYEIKYKQNRTSKMKKIIYSIAVLAMAAMTFTGCESIPAPYDLDYTDPNEGVDLGTLRVRERWLLLIILPACSRSSTMASRPRMLCM